MNMHWCPCGGQVEAGGKAPPGGGECLSCERVFDSPAAVVAAGGTCAQICIRGRRSRRPQLCLEDGCTHEMVALCDHPVALRRTCDRPICSQHRTMVGKNRDRCPAHAPQQEIRRAP